MNGGDSFAEIHPPFAPQAAVVEANRCLFCFDAPCTAACPTHIDVPRFIKKIASGNLKGSAATILASNILGLSCSRVCPVDVLCEGACVMHRYNKQPIEIGRLQRHAMDHFYSNGATLPLHNVPQRKAKVACIGAGPASLACAAELRRHGFPVTIFDAMPLAGGLNTYGVAQYKLRPGDSLREVELVRSLGVEFKQGVQIGADLPLEQLEDQFNAIFIGIGLGPTGSPGLLDEHKPGVIDALRFIADYKTGRLTEISGRVAVIGAGNTAIDAANAAHLLGAGEVHMLYRRSEKEMPAFPFEYEHAKQYRIRFHWLTQPIAIVGGNRVTGVECLRTELGPPDQSGRRTPQPLEGSNFVIPCELVIPALGQTRLLDLLEKLRGVEIYNGNIVTGAATGQTKNPKYFAGGDCVNGGREVVDAVAEGKRAGQGIAAWLT